MRLPDLKIPADLAADDMPDLLRYWYLGTRARRHMALRRFAEVDAELPAAGAILDIGSAWGYNVMALGALGRQAVAMDLVVDQFTAGARIAAENAIEFNALGADAAALPFGDATFDAITMVEMFEHVYEADRARVLAECHRVLRSRGRLVLSTPNYASFVERFKRIAVRHPRLQKRFPTMCYPAGHVERDDYHPYRYHNPLSARDIACLLDTAGFDVVRTKFFLFVTKNTPDAFYAPARAAERLLEHLPGLGRLAATVCIVADKRR